MLRCIVGAFQTLETLAAGFVAFICDSFQDVAFVRTFVALLDVGTCQ